MVESDFLLAGMLAAIISNIVVFIPEAFVVVMIKHLFAFKRSLSTIIEGFVAIRAVVVRKVPSTINMTPTPSRRDELIVEASTPTSIDRSW